jgi:hypothetical protein
MASERRRFIAQRPNSCILDSYRVQYDYHLHNGRTSISPNRQARFREHFDVPPMPPMLRGSASTLGTTSSINTYSNMTSMTDGSMVTSPSTLSSRRSSFCRFSLDDYSRRIRDRDRPNTSATQEWRTGNWRGTPIRERWSVDIQQSASMASMATMAPHSEIRGRERQYAGSVVSKKVKDWVRRQWGTVRRKSIDWKIPESGYVVGSELSIERPKTQIYELLDESRVLFPDGRREAIGVYSRPSITITEVPEAWWRIHFRRR